MEKKLNKQKIKRTLFQLSVIISFILQPRIVEACLEMFRCKNLGSHEDPVYYMAKEPQVECWKDVHNKWAYGLALPALIIWAFVLPYLLFRYLKKNKENLKSTTIVSKVSFLITGYKPDKYYWYETNSSI